MPTQQQKQIVILNNNAKVLIFIKQTFILIFSKQNVFAGWMADWLAR